MTNVKKTVICILLLLIVAFNVTAAKVPLPIEVFEDTSGDLKTITKVYEFESSQTDESIPKKNFTQDGVEYALREIIEEANQEEDIKEHTETVSVQTQTNNTEKVIASFEPVLEVTTEDEYYGVLELDYTTLKVEASGYGKQSYTITEKRSYPNLSDADTSLVPKTIQKDGATLSLTGISWNESQSGSIDGQQFAVRYTANATYSGTGTKSYVKGYTATAEYKGEVRKVVKETVIYSAIFEEVPKPVAAKEENPIYKNWWMYLLGGLGISGSGYGIYRIIRKKREGY